MRFYNFINEELSEQELDKLIPYMQRECKRFLNTLEKLNGSHLIYSGRKENDGYIIKQVHKKRKPKDTPQFIHDILNQYFEEQVGIRLRDESVFVMTDSSLTTQYGNTFAIFPMGKYQLWSNPKVEDLFNTIDNIYVKLFREIIGTGKIISILNFPQEYPLESGKGKEVWERLKKELKEIVKNYQRGFPTKGQENIEWMLHCESYIGIREDNVAEVIERLGLKDSVVK